MSDPIHHKDPEKKGAIDSMLQGVKDALAGAIDMSPDRPSDANYQVAAPKPTPRPTRSPTPKPTPIPEGVPSISPGAPNRIKYPDPEKPDVPPEHRKR